MHTEFGTFEDVSHEIKKVAGPVDTSHFKTVPWYDREQEKKRLSQGAMEMQAANRNNWNAAEAAEALNRTKVVMTEVKSVAGKFYDGMISEEDLQAEYERLSERYVDAYAQSGYPSRMFCNSIQTQLGARELFYDKFRGALLSEAVARNNAEGHQYATGETGNGRRVKYYNSDYYYKSEAAISAITKGAFAVAEVSKAQCEEFGHHGYEFEVPDYQSTMAVGAGDPFLNFNSAWSRTVLGGNRFLTSCDAVPPKNFIWFYESEGPDLISDSASTWAYFRDECGAEYFSFRYFNFEGRGEGLFRISELLNFKIRDQEPASRVERFLDCLQVFRQEFCTGRYLAGEMNVFA